MAVAILGLGTVGSGVAKLLLDLPPLHILPAGGEAPRLKYVVDIRELPKNSPYAPYWTRDYQKVLDDPEVSVVVETIGGTSAAYAMSKSALMAGKSLVTSNKALVASHGRELLDLAASKGVCYLFEASAGGGIPLLHVQTYCLAANRIRAIAGILNGTTNYILERMKLSGLSLEEALREAQDKGYAEQDPTEDIEGYDAARKITILASLRDARAYNFQAFPMEGIREVNPTYFRLAEAFQADVKLLALARWDERDRPTILTALHLIPKMHPLAAARGVMNAVAYDSSALGEAMFYGAGAGSLPTASAVVSDILETGRDGPRGSGMTWAAGETYTADRETMSVSALLFRMGQTASIEETRLLGLAGARPSLEFVPAAETGDDGAEQVGPICSVHRLDGTTEARLADLRAELRAKGGDWRTLRLFKL